MSRRKQQQAPWSLFAFQDIITSVTGIIISLTLIMALEVVIRPDRSPAKQSKRLVDEMREVLLRTTSEIGELQQSVLKAGSTVDIAASISASQIHRENNEAQQKIMQLEGEIERLRQNEMLVDKDLSQWRSNNTAHDADRKRLDDAREEIATTEGDLERLRQSQRVFYNSTGLGGKTAWLVDLSEDSVLVAPYGKAQPPIVFQDANMARQFLKWALQRSPSGNHFVLVVRPKSITTFKTIRDRLDKEGFTLGFDLLGYDKTIIDPETGTSM